MKIQVAVFFGGRSVEHEVSIISAMQVCAALNSERYEAVPVYMAKDGALYSGSEFLRIESYKNLPRLLETGRQVMPVRSGGKVLLMPTLKRLFNVDKPIPIDVALPVVHGTFAEDGSLQGFLEVLELPYTGCDVLSSALCMDKPVAKALLRAQALPVLPEYTLTADVFAEKQERCLSDIETEFPYPVIVKPANLGSSVGISKAENRDKLAAALSTAFRFADKIMVEPAVVHLREINVSVLGDRSGARASVCEEPLGQDEILSYNDKYLSSGKVKNAGMSSAKRVIPADLPEELEQKVRTIAVRAFRSMGCAGVARIDFLYDTSRNMLYINELNTIPGSLSFYLWEKNGVSFPQLLEELIEQAFARQRNRAGLNYTIDTNLLANTDWKGSKTE